MAGSKEGMIFIIIFAALFLLTAVFLLWTHNSADFLTKKVNNLSNPNSISNHTCTQAEQEAKLCSLEYFPVCDNLEKTHSNGCRACASGAVNWTAGEC